MTSCDQDDGFVKKLRFDLPPLPSTSSTYCHQVLVRSKSEGKHKCTSASFNIANENFSFSHPCYCPNDDVVDRDEGNATVDDHPNSKNNNIACISPTPVTMTTTGTTWHSQRLECAVGHEEDQGEFLGEEYQSYSNISPTANPPHRPQEQEEEEEEQQQQQIKKLEMEHQQRNEDQSSGDLAATCDDDVTRGPPKRRKKETRIMQETTRLNDIIGHGGVKLRIDELILPLGLPVAVASAVLTGIRATPASVLLYGPPGTGKTQLARAIAGEARAAFLPVAPSDVLSKFVGDSEASVRNIFRTAVVQALQLESKCAVVFFDEIDALGQNRDNLGAGEGEGCSRRYVLAVAISSTRVSSVFSDSKFSFVLKYQRACRVTAPTQRDFKSQVLLFARLWWRNQRRELWG
jgi:SpoVK/Ycf46/Vps4 family AAA+-type ATPase